MPTRFSAKQLDASTPAGEPRTHGRTQEPQTDGEQIKGSLVTAREKRACSKPRRYRRRVRKRRHRKVGCGGVTPEGGGETDPVFSPGGRCICDLSVHVF